MKTPQLFSQYLTQSWSVLLTSRSRASTVHHLHQHLYIPITARYNHHTLCVSASIAPNSSLREKRAPSTIQVPTARSSRSSMLNTLRRFFSTRKMICQKIDGAVIAKDIKQRLQTRIQEAQSLNPEYKPSLKILQIGDRPDSTKYVRMKQKAADEANVMCELIHLPATVTESELLSLIHQCNVDRSVHAVLVQLPLPEHISEHAVTSAISETKDVDGFRTSNIGELAKRGGKPLFVPCTPKGVMVLLAESGVDPRGKHAVVLGRSDIVGGPVSYLLRNADATVTVCHSQTQDLPKLVGLADILIVAIGKPRYVQGAWLKKGAVIIDVGTNYVPDASKRSGWGLVGDVDYESAVQFASHITPVPGGVGPMTVAMLLQNVVEAATIQLDNREKSVVSCPS